MFEWCKNSFVFLNRLNTLMKKINTAAEIPTSKAKAEKPAATKVIKKTPEKSTATKITKKTPEKSVTEAAQITPETSITTEVTKTTPKKTSPMPKPAKKAAIVDPEPIVSSSKIAMHERIGLSAGSIWHYLTENGETSVTKLVDALPEEEELIQRSIGWLAQEDKITLSVADQIETIALKG
jgi:hypothetical protein